jgi:anti-sigma B factor antagonist
VLWIGKAAVVCAPAQIDAGNADDVLASILAVICEDAALLIVDMTATTFCDCSAVSGLVRAFRQAHARGVEMRLVAHEPAVTRVLSLTGADLLMDTYPSVAEALIGGLIPPGSLGPAGARGTGGRAWLRLSRPRRPAAAAAHR